jgi:hypothetical protein
MVEAPRILMVGTAALASTVMMTEVVEIEPRKF